MCGRNLLNETLNELEELKKRHAQIEFDYIEAKEDFRASCKLIKKIDEEHKNKDELILEANSKILSLEEMIEKERLTLQVKICTEREKFEGLIKQLTMENSNLEKEIQASKQEIGFQIIKEDHQIEDKTDTRSLSQNLNRDIQKLAEKSRNERIHFDCISYSHLDLREKIKELSKSREEIISDDEDGVDSPYFDDECNSWNIRTCEVNMNKNVFEKSDKTLIANTYGINRGMKRDMSTMGFTVDDQKTVKFLNKNASLSNVTLFNKEPRGEFDYVKTPSGKKILGKLRKSGKRNLLSFGKISDFNAIRERKRYDSDNKENIGMKRKTIEFNVFAEDKDQRRAALDRVRVMRSHEGQGYNCQSGDFVVKGDDCCGNRSIHLKCALI